ncbi:MAG: hypothetical protein J6L92_09095 [Clostridia bacterium]|nr:hypothetical protein [Clostridia bacterium]
MRFDYDEFKPTKQTPKKSKLSTVLIVLLCMVGVYTAWAGIEVGVLPKDSAVADLIAIGVEIVLFVAQLVVVFNVFHVTKRPLTSHVLVNIIINVAIVVLAKFLVGEIVEYYFDEVRRLSRW